MIGGPLEQRLEPLEISPDDRFLAGRVRAFFELIRERFGTRPPWSTGPGDRAALAS